TGALAALAPVLQEAGPAVEDGQDRHDARRQPVVDRAWVEPALLAEALDHLDARGRDLPRPVRLVARAAVAVHVAARARQEQRRGGGCRRSPPAPWPSAGSSSVNAVLPLSDVSTSLPSIRSASSRAMARPSP